MIALRLHQAKPLPYLLLSWFMVLAVPAHADDEDLFLGVAHYHRVGPYNAKVNNTYEPTGDYDGERFLIRGDTVGVKVEKTGPFTFSAVVESDLLAFRAGRARTHALRLVNDRLAGINAGVEMAWKPNEADAVYVDQLADIYDRSGAIMTSVDYEHTFSIPGTYTQIIPSLAYTHYVPAYTKYYFGITPAEAARSGLSTYNPGSTSRQDIGLTLVQPLSHQVAVFFDYTHKRYGSAVADSPMVAHPSYFEAEVGMVFNFKGLF